MVFEVICLNHSTTIHHC